MKCPQIKYNKFHDPDAAQEGFVNVYTGVSVWEGGIILLFYSAKESILCTILQSIIAINILWTCELD